MVDKCCKPCVNFTVDCNEQYVDSNCYVTFDPHILNLRKIYKKYEEMARNVRFELDCNGNRVVSCGRLAKIFDDYCLVAAGYTTYGGCPKKSSTHYYNVNEINRVFAEKYVVDLGEDEEDLRVICEDKGSFQICQQTNVIMNSKIRFIFIFKYLYDLSDTIHISSDDCKAWKYDVYICDIPNSCPPSNDSCKYNHINLHHIYTLNTKNLYYPLNKPYCLLCRVCPRDILCEETCTDSSHTESHNTHVIQTIITLFEKYSL